MKTALSLTACLAVAILSPGCQRSNETIVTQYGPEYMTYIGSGRQFDEACRAVLREISYKEKLEDNGTRYPYYGEGSSSRKSDDKLTASESYLKTKDDDGVEYKITTIRLGTRDPVVILESTSSNPYDLLNALNAEFYKRGIRVQQY